MSILQTARPHGLAHEPNIGDVERWASVVGGGLLAIYGITRRDRGGLLMALMGGGLAARGVSGHSRLYDGFEVRRFDGAQARDHQGVQGTAIKVERAVTINRVVPELFRFWRQLENLPRFMKNVEAVLRTYALSLPGAVEEFPWGDRVMKVRWYRIRRASA